MRAAVADLVVFDDDEAGDREGQGEVIEACVPKCTFSFLLFCVGGLDDKDAFSEEEDGSLKTRVSSVDR